MRWFGCVRKTYNWALASIKEKKYPINRIWLVNRFVIAHNIPKEFNYLKDTPKHVREGAIDDLVDAYKINFNKGERFEMKFRSRKEAQSIVIPYDSIKSYKDNLLKMYPTMLPGTLRMYSKQPIEFKYDCRMSMDKLGRFYLHVPLHRSASPCENQAGIVALDPGVRTFLTAYGLKGNTTVIKKIGHNDIGRIYRLASHLDKLMSKQSKKKKKSLKRAEVRLRNRMKNLVKEVHWKAASWLCKTFKNIIIPSFDVSKMTNRKTRKIGKKTVKSMLH
ncbi:MAG: transposase, partial [Bacteroidota bacterium]